MRKGGGKSKGSEFERWVCKQLSLAMSKDERDDLFWRSAISGGRATVKFKKGKKNLTQVGDITAIDPLGSKLTDKFVIECKRYKSVKWDSLIYGLPKKDGVIAFWRQAQDAADKVNKIPLLIIKANGKIPVICVNSGYIGGILMLSTYFGDFKIFWFSNFLENIKEFLK